MHCSWTFGLLEQLIFCQLFDELLVLFSLSLQLLNLHSCLLAELLLKLELDSLTVHSFARLLQLLLQT